MLTTALAKAAESKVVVAVLPVLYPFRAVRKAPEETAVAMVVWRVVVLMAVAGGTTLTNTLYTTLIPLTRSTRRRLLAEIPRIVTSFGDAAPA